MGFYASSFIFDDIPSDYYGLKIFNFGSAGTQNASAGGDISLITEAVSRRPVPYFFGVNQNEVLTFPLVFGSYSALDANTINAIHQWLFGRMGYKKLVIVQPDMMDCYYNCFFTKPNLTHIGNLRYAFETTVVCDSPWAWSYEKTFTKTFAGEVVNETFSFENQSANNDYLYPTLTFALNSVGNGITIINQTDSNRQFVFTELSANESITIDNDRQIVTSNTGLRRLSKFNLNWFRLLPGTNVLNVVGGVSNMTLTYQFAKKIGG